MEQITIDDVKQAVSSHGIQLWTLRRCSMCHSPLTYAFDGDLVTFDSNCDCVSYFSPPQIRDWEDVTEVFNMQTPEVRQQMWDEFIASGHNSEGKD